MNKRLKKKTIKKFLDKNLNVKIYVYKEEYDNPCKRCSSNPEIYDEDGLNCCYECDGLPNWVQYRFKEKILDNIFVKYVGKDYLDNWSKYNEVEWKIKNLGWKLEICHNIYGYDFVFNCDVITKKYIPTDDVLDLINYGYLSENDLPEEVVDEIKYYIITSKIKK